MSIINILRTILCICYTILIKIFYPQKQELIEQSPLIVRGYIIPQKILNMNGCRNVPWPVHFTSIIRGNVRAGKRSYPGIMPGNYIQGINGIIIGDNVWVGPGVKIISANHDFPDLEKHIKDRPVTIGNNVWIGSNAIILPGVSIGNNCIIGAGSVVTSNVIENTTVAGNPAGYIKKTLCR